MCVRIVCSLTENKLLGEKGVIVAVLGIEGGIASFEKSILHCVE